MIEILIVDDHPIVRQGLKQVLAEEPDIRVFADVECAAELMERIGESHVDVVLLDIALPDRNGLDVLKDIKAVYPRLPVLILSMHPEDQYAIRALKAGAAGYINKKSAAEELVKAIRKAVAGGRYVSPTLAEKLAVGVGNDLNKPPHDQLSDREFQVLCMIASGKKYKDIAEELGLSVKTVGTYRLRLMEKMNMSSNVELIHYAIKHGLIE
ncbi:MAG: response regulator transcription factor [Actinomycetota bacterium]|nr:response regulator transcription factor [Actinomycetota bacterium]